MASAEAWAPDACTLPTVDQPIRLAEFDDLLGADALGVRRVNAGCVAIDLRPDHAVAARAADLAARESGCCSFFTFTLRITDGTTILEIATPAAYVTVLDALVARAQDSRSSSPPRARQESAARPG